MLSKTSRQGTKRCQIYINKLKGFVLYKFIYGLGLVLEIQNCIKKAQTLKSNKMICHQHLFVTNNSTVSIQGT